MSTVAAPKSGSSSKSDAAPISTPSGFRKPCSSCFSCVSTPHDVAREVHEQQHARELGHLEVHDAKAQPAPAAVDFVAEPGNEHDDEQQKTHGKQGECGAAPHAHRDRHGDDRAEQTKYEAD